MNKYVEEYIAKRKIEIEKEKQAERIKLFTKLQIGEKEYRKDYPNEEIDAFPEYDNTNFSYFRRNIGNITDEDYAELLKYVPNESKTELISNKKMSGWYYFAIIMIFLGCIGSLLVGGETKSVIAGIASALGVIIFFSQIILLCKIEYNTRSNS